MARSLPLIYPATVALLCRVHALLSAKDREALRADGDPMARVAADFNSQGYLREMIANGPDRWAIFDREAQVPAPAPAGWTVAEGERS